MRQFILKRAFLKERPESDLNKESANAAAYYMENTGLNGLPIKEKQDAINYLAAGFYMGFRKLEEELGVKRGQR